MRALAAGLSSLPLLSIPSSNVTVNVKAFNSYDTHNPHTRLSIVGPPSSAFYFPTINTGATLDIDILAFYIEHPSKDGQAGEVDRVMFDVGLRKDLENLPPSMRDVFKGNIPTDIPEQLIQGGIDLDSIQSVFWSHAHLDHIGDMSLWPNTTELVIGEATDTRTWPTHANASLLDSDFAGKTVRKLPFSSSTLSIGGFSAIDFFQDGSFYLLDMPGHCPGHMGGLARVTTNPSTFILLAGDSFHNAGEVRPSPNLHKNYPIPPDLLSSSQQSISREFFFAPDDERDLSTLPSPILSVGEKFNFEPERTRVTQLKLGVFDSDEDVLVISAHDPSYEHYMELFPESLNEWKRKGWKGIAVWQFGNVTNRAFVLKKDHYPSGEERKRSEKKIPTPASFVDAKITSTAEGHDEL